MWTHDTAIAVLGLAREGLSAEVTTLADGLLAAAPAFDYRMPELHSAACRPQASSSAAAVAVWSALTSID